LCVRGIVTKPVPCQEDERSYICVLEVIYLCVRGIVTKSVPSQEDERSCICVLDVLLPSLYQARKMRGHVYVC
jgi:hypothetical protein